MKVFVAGASGVIGRPVVRRLVAAGHEVTGITRREERAGEIRAAGASSIVCDVFDAAGLEAAVREAAPEVVIHELTSLPARLDYKAKEDPLAATNRVRSEGTRNLVAAARAAGARRLFAAKATG
jgi:nucleoside-diphosphate-sugar epimerase